VLDCHYAPTEGFGKRTGDPAAMPASASSSPASDPLKKGRQSSADERLIEPGKYADNY
jgi:hypothetical protein